MIYNSVCLGPEHSIASALEVIFNVMRSINQRFTYLLTYLLRRPTLYAVFIIS